MLSVASNNPDQSLTAPPPIESDSSIVSRPPRSRQPVMISMSKATMNDMDTDSAPVVIIEETSTPTTQQNTNNIINQGTFSTSLPQDFQLI